MPNLFFAQSLQFNLIGKKNKLVKNASVYFDNTSCGSDSLAVFNQQLYQFNCFPEGVVPVHIEAKGYEIKTLLINKQSTNSIITINLLKKGWQTIKLENATYKFWKLKNVLYVKEKDKESMYRLRVLLDSLEFYESPYYGKDYYINENGQDFSAYDSPIIDLLRKSEYTLVAAPVILLYRELKDGEKKFQSVNQLLPIANVIEFEENKAPTEQELYQYGLEKYWIYDNQVGGSSPYAFKTVNQSAGLCVLDIIEILQKNFPDVQPKVFNLENWYSLDFNQSITNEEIEKIDK